MAITIDNAVRLPVDVEKEAVGGPVWNTDVVIGGSGFVSTNQRWERPLYRFDISYGIQTLADLNDVRDVFMGARGRAYGFRFKDWADYEIPLITNVIGTGDGVETAFQIYKVYNHTVRPFSRKITRPVSGTMEVQVAGVPYTEGAGATGYSVNYSTGIITFNVAPPNLDAIYCKCQFDVPVMFSDDSLMLTLFTEDAGLIEQIMIQEVRE